MIQRVHIFEAIWQRGTISFPDYNFWNCLARTSLSGCKLSANVEGYAHFNIKLDPTIEGKGGRRRGGKGGGYDNVPEGKQYPFRPTTNLMQGASYEY